MNSYKGKFFVLALLGLLVFVNFNTMYTVAHGGNEHTIAPSYSTWNLTDWNEDNPVEWDGKGINISATIGTTLSYNVTYENEGKIRRSKVL